MKGDIKSSLETILKTMDVPKLRFNDYSWLNRNLIIRNADHPSLRIALKLIDELIKKGQTKLIL